MKTEHIAGFAASGLLGFEQRISLRDIASRFHSEDNHERLKLVELESLARIYGFKNPANLGLQCYALRGEKHLDMTGIMASNSTGVTQPYKLICHSVNRLLDFFLSFRRIFIHSNVTSQPNARTERQPDSAAKSAKETKL